MHTNTVLTTLVFHCCGEVHKGKPDVRDGFVSNDFQSDEVAGKEAETVSDSKRMRVSDNVPAAVTLPTVLAYFSALIP